MLDRRFVRENPDAVRAAIRKRHIEFDLDSVLAIDERLLDNARDRDELKAEQNRLSKAVPTLQGEDQQAAIRRSKELGRSIKPLDDEQARLEAELTPMLLAIPNMPDDEVPDGGGADDNVELRQVGSKPTFDFDVADHVDLATSLGLLDMKRAASVTGSRYYFLKGDLMRLEQAVLRYALDLITGRGYIPMSPPVIVNKGAMEGTGYLPTGADQAFELTRDDGWMIGTAEVPLTALHAGEKLAAADLPLRYAGLSLCFRREAGAHGKDTRGLYRVHQFTKVEQVIIAPNDVARSRELHEEILQNAEDVLQGLGLHYRVVALCGGDLGRGAAYTYDIETWMPGRDGYGETHSASRYYEYQARRLNLRYRDENKKVRICHTLNNTVLASPRILVALLENYQQADGSVRVPDVLVPYMSGIETLQPLV
ncbi:MAG: serine--tRNA ligase [Planctomycetota bacterium]|jgi:seryl-tRNA synthetase